MRCTSVVCRLGHVRSHWANINEKPRNRKTPKRGRTRFFNEAIHALRLRVECTFTWEDTFKRLLLRFERIQQRHYEMKLLAYTLSNLQAFCGIYNSQSVKTHTIGESSPRFAFHRLPSRSAHSPD